MDEETRRLAADRTEAALERLLLRDPRDQFREWLRALRDSDAEGFDQARRYYEEALVPRLADDASDAIAEWVAYGRLLAEKGGAGRLAVIDATGRARDYAPPPTGELILFLPEDAARRALILALPRNPSPAQRATCDLLVLGKLQSAAGA